MKKILLILGVCSLIVILSLGVVAAERAGDAYELPRPAKPDKTYTIGVALPHLANPHFLGHAYGYYSEAEALGVDLILYEAGGYQHIGRQVQQMEDFISMGVDAIILVATSGEATAPIVDVAVSSGIPVINVNVMTNSENVVTRIRSDDHQIGAEQAKYMAEQLNKEGKVLLLPGPAGTSWAMGRRAGFIDYMEANCPEIEIVGEQFCDSDPSVGLSTMEDMLLAYPDIDGVMTGSDFLGIGAKEAIVQAGKSDDIVITTADSQDATIEAIKEGTINATVVQAPCYMARWGVRAAVMTLEGNKDQLAMRYWTPIVICDSSNVEGFEFVGRSKPPEGWEISQ